MDLIERLKQAKTEAEIEAIEREMGGAHIVETLAEVAAWWGFHEQTVKGWRGEGCPGEEGWYDLREIAKWRLAKAEGRLINGDETERELKRQREAIRNESAALDLAKKKNLLGNKEEMLSDVTEAFAAVRSRIEAMPAEFAPRFPPEMRDDLVGTMRDFVKLVLKELEAIGDAD